MNDQDFFSYLKAPSPKELKGSELSYSDPRGSDMFRSQEKYDPMFFDPKDVGNYDRWADKETWGSTLSKSVDSFAERFGGTYSEWFKGYGRMANALMEWDWDKMLPTEDELTKGYYESQMDMNKNYVFASPEEQDDIFGKKFAYDLISNSGFALGTTAAVLTELGIDMAVTALTGGGAGGSILGTLARATGKATATSAITKVDDVIKGMSQGFKMGATHTVDDILKLSKQAKEASNLSKSSKGADLMYDYYNSVKVVLDKNFKFGTGKDIINKIPLVGTAFNTAEKMVAGAGELTAANQVGLALFGARRLSTELNVAASEATFEAFSSYGSTYDILLDNHMKENNGVVSKEDIQKIKDYSLKTASSNYDTNVALLLATNSMQFGNLFNKYIPQSKWLTKLLDESPVDVVKKGNITQLYEKGLLGTIGNLPKFGGKEALKKVGQTFGKNLLKFEISEGIQENLQEASSEAWQKYYLSKYEGIDKSIEDSFGEGVSSQFSKQGFKTFLLGALTGYIIAPATNTVSYAQKQLMTSRKDKAQFKQDIAILNDFYKNLNDKTLGYKVLNFAGQAESSIVANKAAAESNLYQYHNALDSAFSKAILSASRTNTSKVMIDAISSLGDMSDKEFEDTFGIKLKDTKYSTPKAFANKVSTDFSKYLDLVEDLTSSYKSYLSNPNPIKRSVAKDIVDLIAIDKVKEGKISERLRGIYDSLSNSDFMKEASIEDFNNLTNLDNLNDYIGTVKYDIQTSKSLNESVEDKEKLLNNLTQWKNNFSVDGFIVDNTIAEDLFYNIFNLERNESSEKSFNNLVDYINLSGDGKNLNSAINELHVGLNGELFLSALLGKLKAIINEEYDIASLSGENKEVLKKYLPILFTKTIDTKSELIRLEEEIENFREELKLSKQAKEETKEETEQESKEGAKEQTESKKETSEKEPVTNTSPITVKDNVSPEGKKEIFLIDSGFSLFKAEVNKIIKSSKLYNKLIKAFNTEFKDELKQEIKTIGEIIRVGRDSGETPIFSINKENDILKILNSPRENKFIFIVNFVNENSTEYFFKVDRNETNKNNIGQAVKNNGSFEKLIEFFKDKFPNFDSKTFIQKYEALSKSDKLLIDNRIGERYGDDFKEALPAHLPSLFNEKPEPTEETEEESTTESEGETQEEPLTNKPEFQVLKLIQELEDALLKQEVKAEQAPISRDVESTAKTLDSYVMSKNPGLKNSNFSKELEEIIKTKMEGEEYRAAIKAAAKRSGKDLVPMVNIISEAYHAGKAAGKETELVKAVESLLSKEQAPESGSNPTSEADIERRRQEELLEVDKNIGPTVTDVKLVERRNQMLARINAKYNTELASLNQPPLTTKPSVESDAESMTRTLDAEQVRNKLQEIEKQPVKINVTQDANGKMEQTAQEVIDNIKAELDKTGLPYSDVVSNYKGSTYFVVTKDGQQHEILRLLKTGGEKGILVASNLTKAKWINHLIKTEKDGVVKVVSFLLSKEQTSTAQKNVRKKININKDLINSKDLTNFESDRDSILKNMDC